MIINGSASKVIPVDMEDGFAEKYTSDKQSTLSAVSKCEKKTLYPRFAARNSNGPVGTKRKNEETMTPVSKKIKTNLRHDVNAKVSTEKKIFDPPVIKLQSPELCKQDALTPLKFGDDTPQRSSTLPNCPADSSPQRHGKTVLDDLTDMTQKAHILTGTVIFVDFRSDRENRGNVLKKVAKMMGATVVDKLVAAVTHVIFKDGSRITYQKAKKAGQFLVSAGWLEESKKEGRKMPESEFPSVSADKYDTPGLFPKIKKMKSMQPKTLDEDFEAAGKARDRKQRMSEKKLLKEKEAKELRNPVLKIKYPPHEHYYKGSPHFARKSKNKSAADSSLNEVLKEFQTTNGTPIKLDMMKSPILSPKSPSETDFDTPLARRLANKYLSPVVSRNILTSTSSPAVLMCLAAEKEGVDDLNDNTSTTGDAVCSDVARGVGNTLNVMDDMLHHISDKETPDEPSSDVEISNPKSKSPGRSTKSADLKVDNIENRKPGIMRMQTTRQSKFITPYKNTQSLESNDIAPQTSTERRKRFVLTSRKSVTAVSPHSSASPGQTGFRKRKLDDSVGNDVESCVSVETPSKRLRV